MTLLAEVAPPGAATGGSRAWWKVSACSLQANLVQTAFPGRGASYYSGCFQLAGRKERSEVRGGRDQSNAANLQEVKGDATKVPDRKVSEAARRKRRRKKDEGSQRKLSVPPSTSLSSSSSSSSSSFSQYFSLSSCSSLHASPHLPLVMGLKTK